MKCCMCINQSPYTFIYAELEGDVMVCDKHYDYLQTVRRNRYREMYKRMLSNATDDALWEVAMHGDIRINRNMFFAAHDILAERDSCNTCPECGQLMALHEYMPSSPIEPGEIACPGACEQSEYIPLDRRRFDYLDVWQQMENEISF